MHGDATPSNAADGNDRPAADQMAYKIPHAAKVLDMGVRTVWALVHAGDIKSFTVGRSRRIAREDLDAYVQGLRQQAAA